MLGFTDAEAAKILEAACYSTNPAILWPPLLCATSGARMGEMAQLRREGVIVKRGIPALRITAEAGSVKYDNSERTIPIHPTVLAAGFMGVVESQERTAVLHPCGRQQPEMTSFGPSTTAPRMSSWGGKHAVSRDARTGCFSPEIGLLPSVHRRARQDSGAEAATRAGPRPSPGPRRGQ